ncbi:hypothetical protein K9L05_00585 [Candidatus Babeliales bacterium]|nr:hypothetical protein [Candidatus Babeliales bacterium]MCF7899130.1 hypothetical protein [Candidatus Babeliales bacterium]
MTKKRTHMKYTEYLYDRLKNPKLALAYLNEALKDEDQKVFLTALKDVLEAQGEDISAFTKRANISRQSFYRILSKSGNPRWNKITSLINAMGLQVHISYK